MAGDLRQANEQRLLSLKNKYKETVQPMGVYQIRNTKNGKVFLGSSLNLPGIINRNRFQLGNGLHPDKALQRDFQDLGEDSFAFEILDTLRPNEDRSADYAGELKMLEALWLEKLGAAAYRGYGDE